MSGGEPVSDPPGAAPGLGRRLVANTLHAASGRVAALLVWLVFTPAILAALGPAAFGVLALFYALTAYLYTLDFGLTQATLRQVAAGRGRDAHGEAGAFATLGLLGYVALGLLWLAGTLALHGALLAWLRIPEALLASARFALFAGPAVFTLCGLSNLTMAVAQGYGRFDLANRILLAITATHAAGLALALGRGWGLEGFVLSAGASWLLGCVLGLVVLRRSFPAFRWAAPREAFAHAGAMFRFGGPMQITNLLAAINLHLDKALLSRFVALPAVTPYELGSRVATGASTLPQLVLLAVLPEAAALDAAGRRERLRELYDRGSRYALTATALVIAPLVACADRLYATWLGPGHGEAALVLRALALALGVSLATGMGTTIARAVARTDLEAWFALVTLAIHLGLSLWLLPRLGLAGALLAVLAGTVAGAAVFMTLLGRALAWPLWRVVLKPCAVPALAVAAGCGAGLALDRLLPAGAGLAAWAILALHAAVTGLAALLVAILTRYFQWREARSLLLGAR